MAAFNPKPIDPDSRDWKEYMEHALMAQFMAIPLPQHNVADDEPHPATHGMEDV